jgi:hypothetical protein
MNAWIIIYKKVGINCYVENELTNVSAVSVIKLYEV